METIEKKFFNLLALIKYVLESKASVPFPKEENTRPYKKPHGYELYHEDSDRTEFESLEQEIQKEVIGRIKTFHYLRNKFEDITRSILVLNGIKGCQHTINFKLIYLLIRNLSIKDIKVTYKKTKNVSYKTSDLEISMLKPKGFWKKGFLRKKLAKIYQLSLEYKDSKISILFLAYTVDGKISIVSFIENSIKEHNGKKVFQKTEEEIDCLIRLISIQDIF